jgi:putative tryptophan/tyrosine transport system substrate-binding protein
MQFDQLKRRDFMSLFGGAAAAAWPLAARAQQPAIPVFGHLHSGSANDLAPFVAAFRGGLKEVGYVEGQNVAIEFRWAENQADRLPSMVADLVERQVAVIVTNVPAALAAKAATTTIPIVFASATDPVKLGLVASLNRPGGNVTGVSFFANDLEAKRLGLLHELIPQATVIAALANPSYPDTADRLRELQEAAPTLGKQIQVVNAATASEIDSAFASFAQRRPDALIVVLDPFMTARRYQLTALAMRHALPAIYAEREYILAGGLMSYSTSITEAYYLKGVYTGRVLKGAKPADLPVERPTRIDLVINLAAAKALGLEVPPMLLARADEVIE